MDKQTHRSTGKDICRSSCTDAQGSTCTDVYTDITGIYNENTGLHRRKCQDISTKCMGVNRGTSADISTENKFVQGRTCAYDKYGMHGTRRDIGTYTVGKVRKGMSYTDAIHWGS